MRPVGRTCPWLPGRFCHQPKLLLFRGFQPVSNHRDIGFRLQWEYPLNGIKHHQTSTHFQTNVPWLLKIILPKSWRPYAMRGHIITQQIKQHSGRLGAPTISVLKAGEDWLWFQGQPELRGETLSQTLKGRDAIECQSSSVGPWFIWYHQNILKKSMKIRFNADTTVFRFLLWLLRMFDFVF